MRETCNFPSRCLPSNNLLQRTLLPWLGLLTSTVLLSCQCFVNSPISGLIQQTQRCCCWVVSMNSTDSSAKSTMIMISLCIQASWRYLTIEEDVMKEQFNFQNFLKACHDAPSFDLHFKQFKLFSNQSKNHRHHCHVVEGL